MRLSRSPGWAFRLSGVACRGAMGDRPPAPPSPSGEALLRGLRLDLLAVTSRALAATQTGPLQPRLALHSHPVAINRPWRAVWTWHFELLQSWCWKLLGAGSAGSTWHRPGGLGARPSGGGKRTGRNVVPGSRSKAEPSTRASPALPATPWTGALGEFGRRARTPSRMGRARLALMWS